VVEENAKLSQNICENRWVKHDFMSKWLKLNKEN
jgi:hypothetical protein